VHQVVFSLHDYIEMHGQQNIKKIYRYGTRLYVIRGRNKLHNVTTRMEEQTTTAVCSQYTHS